MDVRGYPEIDDPSLDKSFSEAGKLHGHKCPSLFYGVKLSLKAIELSEKKGVSTTNIVLEGSSKCIKDGVFSVLGNISQNIRVSMERGKCSLSFGDAENNIKILIPGEIRSKINEMKEKSDSIEDFQKEGLRYVVPMSEEELFSISQMDQEEFNAYFEQ